MVVSDNLRSGITKACFYEPGVDETYAEIAMHSDTAHRTSAADKPHDKAKVEVTVHVVNALSIAKLRDTSGSSRWSS